MIFPTTTTSSPFQISGREKRRDGVRGESNALVLLKHLRHPMPKRRIKRRRLRVRRIKVRVVALASRVVRLPVGVELVRWGGLVGCPRGGEGDLAIGGKVMEEGGRTVVRGEIHDFVRVGIDVIDSKNRIAACGESGQSSFSSMRKDEREGTRRRHRSPNKRHSIRPLDRPVLVILVVDLKLVNVRVTVKVRGDGRMVALEDLIGVVGLVPHCVDFAEGHVADCGRGRGRVSDEDEGKKEEERTDPDSEPFPLGVLELLC